MSKGPGRAVAPDGEPADVVIEEDGTTWLRLEAYGVKVWANLDKLREPVTVPPVSGWRFREPSYADLTLGRAAWMGSAYVRDPGFRFGGVV